MNKKQTILSLTLLLFLCSSCFNKSNFEFEVPETQTTVTTSKRADSQFFVFFTETGISISAEPSDSIDFIELKTEKTELSLVFDSNAPREIYVLNAPSIVRFKQVKYKIHLPHDTPADSTFYHKENRTIREPYIGIDIDLMRYSILRANDQVTLKEGNVLGGW